MSQKPPVPRAVRQPSGLRWVVLACVVLILGAASAVAVPWASAIFWPTAGSWSKGFVAKDGDHLALWVVRIEHPMATRWVWFEKGRIYNKQGVGPSGGSSAAVSCWSWANGTRTDQRYAPLAPGSAELDALLAMPANDTRYSGPNPACWGAMEEHRGWPMRSFACRVEGTMDAASPTPWKTDDAAIVTSDIALTRSGVVRRAATIAGGQNSTGGRVDLGTMRVLPMRPLWAGLIVNAFVYSIVWLALLTGLAAAWRFVSRRFRRTPGHCPKCDYDLGGHAEGGCPECGWNRAPAQRPVPAPAAVDRR